MNTQVCCCTWAGDCFLHSDNLLSVDDTVSLQALSVYSHTYTHTHTHTHTNTSREEKTPLRVFMFLRYVPYQSNLLHPWVHYKQDLLTAHSTLKHGEHLTICEDTHIKTRDQCEGRAQVLCGVCILSESSQQCCNICVIHCFRKSCSVLRLSAGSMFNASWCK